MEFAIGVVLWSLLLGVIAVLIVDSIVIVPAYHYGVLERLGERTGKPYDEGIGFKFPLIDKVIPVLRSLTPIAIEVNFTTADKLQLKIAGSLQYRPDPNGVDDEKRNLFVSISEAVIKDGIEDMIRDVLGGLGGKYTSDDFIKSRQALGDLINNLLQFEIPYHLRHIKPHNGNNCSVEGCDHKGCGVPDCGFDERVNAEKLIEFYNSHWKYLKENRDREQAQKESPSSVEKRYGIEVEVFALSTVGFSDEVKTAFEKKREAELREEAFNIKLGMAKRAKAALDVDGQVALNSADVSLNPEIAGNKTVVSVEGQAGVLGGILGLLKK